MKVLVSAGPIPAMLDSVKLITNKFKGGLVIKTAEALANEFEVTVIQAGSSDIKTHLPTIKVRDVYDYYTMIEQTHADAYILGGAIANLAPALPLPWGDGKFPSHNYKVGDTFDIKFTIAPRSIDMVKQWHPKATLIGYKLFDGTEEELMDAAWHTLTDSRSNVVFANHPKTAKLTKIAMMPDGTFMRMNFDQHTEFIRRVVKMKWYSTSVEPDIAPGKEHEVSLLKHILPRIAHLQRGYQFGTVAIRSANGGFVTTTRGKREEGVCRVHTVDHELRKVVADSKATLNAPTIHKLFTWYPHVSVIIHGHRQVADFKTYPYKFSGTTEETDLAAEIGGAYRDPFFNVENHGYYACFERTTHMEKWLNENYPG